MLAGFPWPERLLLRAPDGRTFEAGISTVCFQTLGGWHHIRNHMNLHSHTGPIGISTADGKVFDVTVDLAGSPAAPKSQPQRSPPQQRPPSQRHTPSEQPPAQALPPLQPPGAPAPGKAAVGPARQQHAGQWQQQQQPQQKHPPQQRQASGSAPSSSVPTGTPPNGQQRGQHQHAAGKPAAVNATAGGADAAAAGQQDGFYLQVHNPEALMLSKRLLRTLFRSPAWPRQLQLTIPGAPAALPVKTESDASGRLLPKNGWAAAAAALAAAAGAPLQQGSVVHVSRPASSGGNELRLRLVIGPELTPSVQAIAAATAGAQWTSSTKYEFFVGAQAGGSRKRQRSDAASGTSGGANPVKRPAVSQMQHLAKSVKSAAASRQPSQQLQQQQWQWQPNLHKVATEQEAANRKRSRGNDAPGSDSPALPAKRQAAPSQRPHVAAPAKVGNGAAAEAAPAAAGSSPQPADSGLSAEAPKDAAAAEGHSGPQPAQPGASAAASAQAAAATSVPKPVAQKPTAQRQGLVPPVPRRSWPSSAPPGSQPQQAQPAIAPSQATAAVVAPRPPTPAVLQQPAGQQAGVSAAPPSQGRQLPARPAATPHPAAAQVPPAAAATSAPGKQAAPAAAAPAQQPQPHPVAPQPQPHGRAQPADPHKPQQQSAPASGSAAASDVKREPQERQLAPALALAPQEQQIAVASPDPQTLASSSQTAQLQLQHADVAQPVHGRWGHVCSLQEADALASATASAVDVSAEALEDAHNAEARVLIEDGRLDWKYKVLMRDDAWGPADPLQPPVHGSARAVLEQGCQFRVWGGSLRQSPAAAPHIGVYARETIPAGSFVFEVVGELVSQAQEPASTAAQRTFLHPLLPPGPVPAAAQAPQPVAWLNLRRKGNIARLLNMAGEHANLRFVYLHDAQRPQAPPHLLLMAVRSIAKGNELLI